MTTAFDYYQAFSRNLGWITEDEQEMLRGKRVAIAGLGGVGSAHVITLARIGIACFNLADFDSYEIVNFNRQFGATMRSLGRPKVDVNSEMALDINPEADIRRFPSGVDAQNVDEFLDGVDLFVDGLDFFVMDAREAVFAACAAKGIPAVTAAPLGWGTALLTFGSGDNSFEAYFRMADQPYLEKLRRFLVGLSPNRLQLQALVEPDRLDIANKRGPSTPVGAALCASVVTTTAVKILLGRGDVPLAPASVHFDAYTSESEVIERPGGIEHPELQAYLEQVRASTPG